MFNPYHHFFFSNGFLYAPPPSEPFKPVSEPRLVVFLPNDTGASEELVTGSVRPGEIGAGDRASASAFWFNAESAFLGCDNKGPEPCVMTISAFSYDKSSTNEILKHQQNVTIPACLATDDCSLQHVDFDAEMTALSGIEIRAFVGVSQRIWFMDNLAMSWYNNTCAAGLLRQESR